MRPSWTGVFAWNDGNSPMMRAVAAILLLMGSIASAAETADTIFINGNVYTVNEKQPRAEAIAVSRDRIVFVGSNANAQKLRTDKTRIIDLAGKTVTPGFTDSHCHIFGIGEREMTLNLEGTNTLEDFLQKMKERVAKTEPGKWITGRGWIETFWKPPQFPTRAELVDLDEQRSGRSMSDVRWYMTLALWKSAIFLEGSYKRRLAGTTEDAFFDKLERGVPELAERAWETACSRN